MTGPVLITRPEHQAAELAAAVAARGFTPILAPCLKLEILRGARLDDTGIAALALTSANGVAALITRFERRDLPLYAVGAATAAAARKAGFTNVESAGGDGPSLAALMKQRCRPQDGAILYPCGEETAFDLGAALEPLGFLVLQVAVYEMPLATSLPKAALDLLDASTPAQVMLFSARSARAFGDLAAGAGRSHALRRLTALCLSPAVSAVARGYDYAAVRAAAEPSQAALIDLLETGTAPK